MSTMEMDTAAARLKRRGQLFGEPLTLLAIGFAVSLFAVGGRWDIPLAAWIAPVFLLRFSRISRFWIAVPALWVATVANAMFWAFELGGGLTAGKFAIAIAFGLVFVLPYVIDRLLAPRLGVVGKLMVFPAAWACTEFLMGELSPLGVIYGLRANTQTEYLSLLQLVAFLGPYSIGFLIGWFATTMNWVWENPRAQRTRSVAAVYGVVLALVLVGGGLRLAFTPSPTNYVRMATVTPSVDVQRGARAMIEARSADSDAYVNPPSQPYAETGLFASKDEVADVAPVVAYAAYAMVVDDLLRSTREAARAGAEVVVWSETAAPVLNDADTSGFIAKVSDVARQENIYINAAMGIPFARNATFLIGPDGKQIWSYDKRHPVPMLEPVPPAHERAPVTQAPFGRLTNVICYDADFPAQSRVDADIMMVPGLEWPDLGRSHTLKWVKLRAIENGYSLIRAAYNSQAAAFDRLGHVLATQDTSGSQRHVMFADVPATGSRTIYNRLGDVLIWISLAGLAVASAAAVRSRREEH
jgi:apolipoprotein N-acyltransferase